MRFHRRTSASRFAQAERKAEAMRAAGIPDREPDQRVTWWVDLRPIGGPWWRCVPRPGHVSYFVYAEPGGERVMCGPAKTILGRAAAALQRPISERNRITGGYSAQDEIDAAAA